MTAICIDTNLFLELYGTDEDSGEVLLPSILRENPDAAALQRTGEDYNRVLWTLYDDIRG